LAVRRLEVGKFAVVVYREQPKPELCSRSSF